ncbi:MAG: DnaJ domain-containing protein, partial [Thermanaerothrix sp.]|nr:DnaJ domain-containing protein [Thermanaerothrix sp.]
MSLEVDLKTLGLSPGASWEDVKSAFRRLARAYHPDVAGPEHSRRFAEINRAYMSIREAVQRGAYDSLGQREGASSSPPPGAAPSRDAAGGAWRARRTRRRRDSRSFRWGSKGLDWLSSIGAVILKGVRRISRPDSGGRGREGADDGLRRDRALWEVLD